MKTSILARAVALICSAATTFVLVQSVAIHGLPADTAPQIAQIAQIAMAVTPR